MSTYPSTDEVQEQIQRVLLETNAQRLVASSFGRFAQAMDDMRSSDENFHAKNGQLMQLGADAAATGQNFTAIHIHQMRDEGIRPSIPGMALHFANEIGLDPNGPEFKAMMLIALKAEVVVQAMDKNEPDYHNRLHFIDVATMTFMNLQRNDQIVAANGGTPPTPEEKAQALMAAIGHDIGHPGGKNQMPGMDAGFDRLRLENQSIDLIGPLMDAAGMSEAGINNVGLHIKATSPDGATQFKDAMLHAINNGEDPHSVFDKPIPMAPPGMTFGNTFPELKTLADNPALLQTVAMVGDADVYASGGAGNVANHDMSIGLGSEWDKAGIKGMDGKAMDLGTDGARAFFLGAGVIGGGFASDAGKMNGNENLKSMEAASLSRMEEAGIGTFDTSSKFYSEKGADAARAKIAEAQSMDQAKHEAWRAENVAPETQRVDVPQMPERAAPPTVKIDVPEVPQAASPVTSRFSGPPPSEAVPDTLRVETEAAPPTQAGLQAKLTPERVQAMVEMEVVNMRNENAAPPPAALGAARIDKMIQEELSNMKGVDTTSPTNKGTDFTAPTLRADGVKASAFATGIKNEGFKPVAPAKMDFAAADRAPIAARPTTPSSP